MSTTSQLFPLPTPAETAEAARQIIAAHGGVSGEWAIRRTVQYSSEAHGSSALFRRANAVNTAILSKLPAAPRKCEGCGEERYVRWYTFRHLDCDTAVPAPELEPMTVRWCTDCVDNATEGFGEYFGICYRAEVRVDFLEPDNQRRNLRLHSPNAIIPADWRETEWTA